MRYGRRFSETTIIDYLKSFAELDAFYILANSDSCSAPYSGLIYYFDSDGESWCFMVENDDLAYACLHYLYKNGAPVFKSIDEQEAFEEKYRKQKLS